MAELKYKIGGIDIDPDLLLLGPGGINPLHRFLVKKEQAINSMEKLLSRY